MVSRIGLPWGGLGLFVNVGYQQALVEQGCDLFIAGESDNYGFRFAQECGIPMIETSHEILRESRSCSLHRHTGGGVPTSGFPLLRESLRVVNVYQRIVQVRCLSVSYPYKICVNLWQKSVLAAESSVADSSCSDNYR